MLNGLFAREETTAALVLALSGTAERAAPPPPGRPRR